MQETPEFARLTEFVTPAAIKDLAALYDGAVIRLILIRLLGRKPNDSSTKRFAGFTILLLLLYLRLCRTFAILGELSL